MNGAQLIAAERERQIAQEGWTPEHDDVHENGELTGAAVAYAVAAHDQIIGCKLPDGPPATWPFGDDEWKAADNPIRNLVKAGALIAAEIDRLKRAEIRRAPAAAPDLRA